MAWYDPDTLEPLLGDEAGKRLQAVDAWADNNRAGTWQQLRVRSFC